MKTLQRIGLSIIFLAGGLLVFIVFSHYYPIYTGLMDTVGRNIAAGIFLALTLVVRRGNRFQAYWLIPFAFFTALSAISVDYYFGLSKWIIPVLGVVPESPEGWALDKLESSLLGIVVAGVDEQAWTRETPLPAPSPAPAR